MTCMTLVIIGYFAGYVARAFSGGDHWLVWLAAMAVFVWALHRAREIDRR